jgi:ATP-dependent RNA helicase DeaD
VAPALRATTIYGGVPYEGQERDLRSGVHIVVGTPGRMIDHLEKGTLSLSNIQYVVLDEADEMLDMGFQDDIEKILKHIPK